MSKEFIERVFNTLTEDLAGHVPAGLAREKAENAAMKAKLQYLKALPQEVETDEC